MSVSELKLRFFHEVLILWRGTWIAHISSPIEVVRTDIVTSSDDEIICYLHTKLSDQNLTKTNRSRLDQRRSLKSLRIWEINSVFLDLITYR